MTVFWRGRALQSWRSLAACGSGPTIAWAGGVWVLVGFGVEGDELRARASALRAVRKNCL